MTDRLQITALADELVSEGAHSIFLYGSRARGDDHEESDWEVGAVYERDQKVSRSELAKRALQATVIYPFIREDLEAGIASSPFTQSIWLNEVIRTGKTLSGERFIETLSPPEITRDDIIADVSFSKARALDAMLALRTGSTELGNDLLVKSHLLGLRNLILMSGREFPLSYDEIAEVGTTLLPEEYQQLLENVVMVRRGQPKPTLDMAFDNLGLFFDVIEPMSRQASM